MVTRSTRSEEMDAAQAHYFRLVAPEAAAKGRLGYGLSGEATFLASLKNQTRDKEAERRFWAGAARAFETELAWLALIRSQSSAPPAE